MAPNRIGLLFESQALQTPSAPALIFKRRLLPTGEEVVLRGVVSYLELLQMARNVQKQVEESLDAMGVLDSHPIVALCMERSPLAVATIIGLALSGCPWMPLDPKEPKRRLQEFSTVAKLILVRKGTDFAWERSGKGYDKRLMVIDDVESWGKEKGHAGLGNLRGAEGDQAGCRTRKRRRETVSEGLKDVAYCMHTTGSTGKPKLVLGSVEGTLARCEWLWTSHPYMLGDLCAIKTSFHFVDSVAEILAPLLKGVPALLLRDQEVRDAMVFLGRLKAENVTRLTMTPSHLEALLNVVHQGSSEPSIDLPALRMLCSSGEALGLNLVRQLRAYLPESCLMLNLYGATELSGDCAYHQVKNEASLQGHLAQVDVLQHASVPIGRALEGTGTVLHVIDQESLRPLTTGTVGELLVEGGLLAIGYLEGDLESDAFIQWSPEPSELDPHPRDRDAYRTGDLVELLPNGTLLYHGRAGRLCKVRGTRVHLDQVEAAIASLECVKAVVVLFLNGSSMQAYVVLELDAPEASSCAVITALGDLVPSQMIPSHIRLLPRLPITASGKVDRKALEALPPEETSAEDRDASQENQNPRTRLVTTAIATALGLGKDTVAASQDFYALGGDSLSAMHATRLVSEALGVNISVQIFTEYSTAMSLLNFLEGGVSKEGIITKQEQQERQQQEAPSKPSQESKAYSPKRPMGGMRAHGGLRSIGRGNRGHGKEASASEGASSEIDDSSIELKPLWKRDLAKCVDASPLVFQPGDGALSPDGATLYIGSHSHLFVALNLKTGTIIWEVVLCDRVESSACLSLDGRHVIVGCYDAQVYVIKTNTGEVVWRYDAGGEVKCSPTLDPMNGYIWVGSHGGLLSVLNIERRTSLWRLPCGGAVFGSPALLQSGEGGFVGTTNGEVLCLHLPSRSVTWRLQVGKPIFSSPILIQDGQAVAFATAGGLVKTWRLDGTTLWERKLSDSPVFSSLAADASIEPGKLYLGSHDSHAYCLNDKDGTILWSTQLAAGLYSSPFLSMFRHRSVIAVATMTGVVCLLDAKSGRNLSQLQYPGEVFSSPVIVSQILVVGCRDNFVHAASLHAAVTPPVP